MNRVRRSTALAAVALLAGATLSACSATQSPLNVGVRDVATTLLLGAGGKATVQAPVPPQVVPAKSKPAPATSMPAPPPPPATTSPAPSTSAATSTPPPNPCPGIDPLAVPLNPAMSTIYSIPQPGTYQQMVTGSVSKGSASVDLPAQETWSVGDISADWTGSYTFTQTVTDGSSTTATTYRVVPEQNTAPQQVSGSPVTPGIYLSSVAADGTTIFRAPDPGMALASLPILPNGSVQASATYGQVTMSYTATVKGLQTLNACGTALAAWQVDLTGTIVDAAIAGPDGRQTFTASYSIGTQYGGLIIAATSHVTGDDAGVQVLRDVSTLPKSEPKLAEAELPNACVLPDPTDPVVLAAPDSPSGAVPTGTFGFRNDDLRGVDRQTPVRGPWSETQKVTIPAGQAGAERRYVVATTDETGSTGTTTYGIVPVGSSGGVAPGIYLVGETTPGEDPVTYAGAGLPLATFPLVSGASVKAADSGTWGSLSFTATVAGHASVPTCDGKNLDSWQIDLTNGTSSDPAHGASETFTASYFLGTEYGGLFLGMSSRSKATVVLPSPGTSSSPGASSSTSPSGSSSASAPGSASATATGTTSATASASMAPPPPVTVQERLTSTINAEPIATSPASQTTSTSPAASTGSP